jgi:hypothetical protein
MVRVFSAISFLLPRVVVDRAAAFAEMSFALSATCSAKHQVIPSGSDWRWMNYVWSNTNGEWVGVVTIGATQEWQMRSPRGRHEVRHARSGPNACAAAVRVTGSV